MLLFCCWHGSTRGIFDLRVFQKALEFSNLWSEHVVLPVRQVRKWMKKHPLPLDGLNEETEERYRSRVGNLRTLVSASDIKKRRTSAEVPEIDQRGTGTHGAPDTGTGNGTGSDTERDTEETSGSNAPLMKFEALPRAAQKLELDCEQFQEHMLESFTERGLQNLTEEDKQLACLLNLKEYFLSLDRGNALLKDSEVLLEQLTPLFHAICPTLSVDSVQRTLMARF